MGLRGAAGSKVPLTSLGFALTEEDNGFAQFHEPLLHNAVSCGDSDLAHCTLHLTLLNDEKDKRLIRATMGSKLNGVIRNRIRRVTAKERERVGAWKKEKGLGG